MRAGRMLLAVGVLLAASCGGGSSPAGPAPASSPDPAEVAAWLGQRAISFDTVEPDQGHGDLQAALGLVGDARVVSLGEATHGTAEFFKMKHRLLRLLVEERGFSEFGIEASFPDTEAINEFVLTGRGDPRRVLAGQGFWTWTTEEVLDMVLWMRAHNARGGRQVTFRGFDMQHPAPSMDAVVDYLREVDPAEADAVSALYEPYRPYSTWETIAGYRSAPSEARTLSRANVAEVVRRLEENRPLLEARSSRAAFALALQHARVVVQAEGVHAGTASRDQYMADNAAWLLDEAGPEARMVLWAHNLHVQRASLGGQLAMGAHLHRRYGAGMVVFGFAFYQGRCTAVGSASRTLGAHDVPAARADSFEAAFERTGRARLLLDTRGVAPGGAGPDWFLAPHPHRNIGALFDPGADYYQNLRLGQLYDVAVFIRDTTASRVYR